MSLIEYIHFFLLQCRRALFNPGQQISRHVVIPARRVTSPIIFDHGHPSDSSTESDTSHNPNATRQPRRFTTSPIVFDHGHPSDS